MAVLGLLVATAAPAADQAPLVLEAKIPLGPVAGRIDHMALDAGRQRLFVAELDNNSVGVVDLRTGLVAHRIMGLSEPQGVGYVPWTDTLVVANGGDGTLRLFGGEALAPDGRIELGDDADNIRIDGERKRVLVGYGGGALAVIDPAIRAKIADIPLKAHPESFQIDPAAGRIYVNVPGAHQIAVLDEAANKTETIWPTRSASANFPMAIDGDLRLVLVAFRSPARLMAFAEDGSVKANLPICGDADDLHLDAKRHRVYVSCGDGAINVLERGDATYKSVATVPTVAGARTSLFVPDLDRLFVAVRAASTEPAALWVFRPVP